MRPFPLILALLLLALAAPVAPAASEKLVVLSPAPGAQMGWGDAVRVAAPPGALGGFLEVIVDGESQGTTLVLPQAADGEWTFFFNASRSLSAGPHEMLVRYGETPGFTSRLSSSIPFVVVDAPLPVVSVRQAFVLGRELILQGGASVPGSEEELDVTLAGPGFSQTLRTRYGGFAFSIPLASAPGESVPVSVTATGRESPLTRTVELDVEPRAVLYDKTFWRSVGVDTFDIPAGMSATVFVCLVGPPCDGIGGTTTPFSVTRNFDACVSLPVLQISGGCTLPARSYDTSAEVVYDAVSLTRVLVIEG